MRFSLLYVFALAPLACSIKATSREPSHPPPPIVLISIDGLDRSGFSKTLERLSLCKPSVVGVMSLLDEPDSTDRIVSKTIAGMGNVVLSTVISEEKVERTNRRIAQNASGEGFIQFAMQNGKAMGHRMMYAERDDLHWSFPLLILSGYHLDKGDEISEATIPDMVYSISFEYPSQAFQVFEGTDSLDCSTLKGKIVLLGYTGPDSEKYLVKLNGEFVEMTLTVAMANAILHLLNSERLEEAQ